MAGASCLKDFFRGMSEIDECSRKDNIQKAMGGMRLITLPAMHKSIRPTSIRS